MKKNLVILQNLENPNKQRGISYSIQILYIRFLVKINRLEQVLSLHSRFYMPTLLVQYIVNQEFSMK